MSSDSKSTHNIFLNDKEELYLQVRQGLRRLEITEEARQQPQEPERRVQGYNEANWEATNGSGTSHRASSASSQSSQGRETVFRRTEFYHVRILLQQDTKRLHEADRAHPSIGVRPSDRRTFRVGRVRVRTASAEKSRALDVPESCVHQESSKAVHRRLLVRSTTHERCSSNKESPLPKLRDQGRKKETITVRICRSTPKFTQACVS